MSKKNEEGSTPEPEKRPKACDLDLVLAVVRPEELYPLSVFQKRFGIGECTLRSARSAGLVVRYIHKRAYLLGRDWIQYILKNASSEPPAPGKRSPTHRRQRR